MTSDPHDDKAPSLFLGSVQYRVKEGLFRLTNRAAMDASELGFDRDDIRSCVCSLAASRCRRSRLAVDSAHAGQPFDQYVTEYGGVGIFVKFADDADGWVRIISFHRGD